MVRRLGGTRSEPVDVWIVTASNEDLVEAIRARRFREDLYHRLAVVTLALPPLRARGDDVVRLAEHFLARACADYGLPSKTAHGRCARGASRLRVARQHPGAGQRDGAGRAPLRGCGGRDRGCSDCRRGRPFRPPARSPARWTRRSSPTPWAAWSGRTSSRRSARRPGTSRAPPRGSESPATPCATAWRSTSSGGRRHPGPRREVAAPDPSRVRRTTRLTQPRPRHASPRRPRPPRPWLFAGRVACSHFSESPSSCRPRSIPDTARAAPSRSWSRRSRRSADESRR